MPRLTTIGSALSALLILLVSKAVFACTVTSTEAANEITAESLSSLQFYHALIILMTVTTIVFFLLRKTKGWAELVAVLIVTMISPGWFAHQNANITPMCEPAFAFEMKLLTGIVLLASIAQALSWYWKSNKTFV